MNTIGSRPGTALWLRPKIALMEIPKRLMMLLSGTDNRQDRSEEHPVKIRITPSEIEELQLRAREYKRQQEQMDDWERAFYREWTSLVSRNALAFPYPMAVATREALPQARIHLCRWKELWRMGRQHPNRSKLLQPSRIGIPVSMRED